MPPPRYLHSTGHTRSSKNCQGKRAVLEVFWSARYCTGQGEAGAYQADAIQTGITRLIVGAWSPDSSAGIVSPVGNVTVITESTTSGAVASTAPLRYLVDIKQRTADKTRPENIALPVALYLGQSAEV